MADSPVVDVIIPVHDASRPLRRPIGSLLRSGLDPTGEMRITVVAHNVSANEVRNSLPDDFAAHVRFLECADGLPSPAGPRTLGLQHSDGTYVAFVDSDDHHDDGALKDWVGRAESRNLDAVLPQQRHDNGARIRTPPTRPWRTRDLHPIRDRLAYRTAPLALLRRDTIQRVDARFETGVRNGSDQIFALKFWFADTRVRLARGGPGYIVGSDAVTRVTTQPHPLESELRATMKLLGDPWFHELGDAAKHAIVVKFVRIQFMAGLSKRLGNANWDDDSAESAVDFLNAARRASPTFTDSISFADARLCQAVLRRAPADELAALVRRRSAFGAPQTVITPKLNTVLAVNAPLRFMAASALA